MADEKKNEPSEDQLDELEDEIEHARRDSDEAVHGSFYEGDKPMFSDSAKRMASGKSSATISADLSSEPLSSTTISTGRPPISLGTDARHRRVSSRVQ